jgi:serine kinase of HPr protein (carbohydrate metabolism regulator)
VEAENLLHTRYESKYMDISGTLVFMCGKMAAGKSTLARELARREHTVLLVQDEFLEQLFPGEITDTALGLRFTVPTAPSV